MVITTESSYSSRLNAWLAERFPVINFISGAIMYFLAKAVVALANGHAMVVEPRDLAGALIPALHLFLLRVFDEHKDYASDQKHYPNRVVQRGIFSLSEIRTLGIIAFIVQTLSFFSLKPQPTSIVLWVVLWVWTALMTKEFFAKAWLKKHFLIYAVSHQVVSPLLLLLLLSLAVGELHFSQAIGYALALSLATGALYEISRKTKGRHEETGDLSYSKLWGAKRSLIILSVMTLITAVITDGLFASLNLTHIGYRIGLLVVVVLCLITHAQYFKDQTAKARKKNEGVAALISAYGFLTPLIASFFV